MAERTVVTKVSNATLYSDGTILLSNVRLSYPHLAKPMTGKNEDGTENSRFGVVGMLPKSTHSAAKDLVKKVIGDLQTANDTKVATDKWFLRNGDDAEQAEYADHFVVSTGESRRPSVRNRKGTPMTEKEAEDTFYGGCWGNILIRPWYFNGKARNGKNYPKRICAGLVGVQFVKDDEPFGEGRISDEGVFESVEEGGSGFDDDDGGL